MTGLELTILTLTSVRTRSALRSRKSEMGLAELSRAIPNRATTDVCAALQELRRRGYATFRQTGAALDGIRLTGPGARTLAALPIASAELCAALAPLAGPTVREALSTIERSVRIPAEKKREWIRVLGEVLAHFEADDGDAAPSRFGKRPP